MSFAARMIHPLAIVTPTTTGEPDEYNHPTAGTPAVALVMGNVQPRKAREIALSTNAGAELADYRIYLPTQDIPESGAWIRDEPDAGRRYDIVGVEPLRFGREPHLEILARLVTSEAPLADTGYES